LDVALECKRCDRAGGYRKEGLQARFGIDIALPDLLGALSSCERRADFSKPCGARFMDLAVAGPLQADARVRLFKTASGILLARVNDADCLPTKCGPPINWNLLRRISFCVCVFCDRERT
jgi:hypothetical protein